MVHADYSKGRNIHPSPLRLLTPTPFPLTVELMEVLQGRAPGHGVVEVGLESAALQETVGHLRQVDTDYGIGVTANADTQTPEASGRPAMDRQSHNSKTAHVRWPHCSDVWEGAAILP